MIDLQKINVLLLKEVKHHNIYLVTWIFLFLLLVIALISRHLYQ